MFVALLEQPGGCDYTIGCGLQLIELESQTRAAAVQELRDLVLEEYTGDDALRLVTLYEVSDKLDMPVRSWYKEQAEERQLAQMRVADSAERELYERLKQKFG